MSNSSSCNSHCENSHRLFTEVRKLMNTLHETGLKKRYIFTICLSVCLAMKTAAVSLFPPKSANRCLNGGFALCFENSSVL